MSEPKPPISDAVRALLAEARRAVLTTIDARDGRPRSVPISFALVDGTLYSPLDEKPKSGSDPLRLRRVRNLQVDARATVLVDRWSEDWADLAFAELDCHGALLPPGGPEHDLAVGALRARYPQYAGHRLEERPILRFTVLAARTWAATAAQPELPIPH